MTGTHTPLVRAARRARPALLLVLLVVLASCGGGGGAGEPQSQPPPPAPPSGQYRPVTVDNCGHSTTYTQPPQRAVGMIQSSTELLLALGLDDRIVGTAYEDSPPLPEQEQAYRAIPKVADQYPSREALVGASADFTITGLDNFAFTEQEGRGRDSLKSLGINTYALQCAADKGNRLEIFNQRIAELGRIFGIEDRATALVNEIGASMDRAEQAVAGAPDVKVFVYHSGQDKPNTFPGEAAATEMIDSAGGVNVVRDVPGVYGPVSWEQVTATNPDVIVISEQATGESTEAKRQFLLSLPAIAQTPAIQQQRIVVLSFLELTPTIRIGTGADKLARALHPDRF